MASLSTNRVSYGISTVFVVTASAFALVAALVTSFALAGAPQPRLELARGNNGFALDLYRRLGRSDENLFFSPFSVRTALALTYAGARGETAAQMREPLRFTLDDDALHDAFGAFMRALHAAAGEHVELVVANGVWGERSYPFQASFVELADRAYGAAFESVDFVHAAEPARARINAWVEEHTRERIRDLIPPGGVTAETRMTLVNAVYFAGRWAAPFEERHTRPGLFHLADGRTVEAPFMTFAKVPMLPFFEGYGLKAIELDYRGRELSMVVVLPDAADGLAAIEAVLDGEALEYLLGQMVPEEVVVYLPRFTLTWGAENLTPPLVGMGIRDLFGDGVADLTGIHHGGELFVSGVFHKAFVDVHEEGTEAAAATAVVMAPTAMPPPQATFRADRPFLFLIREKATGTILFMGRLADPDAL